MKTENEKPLMPIYVTHRFLSKKARCHSWTLLRRLRALGILPDAAVCSFRDRDVYLYSAVRVNEILSKL